MGKNSLGENSLGENSLREFSLDDVKAQQIQLEMTGNDAETQLDYMSLAQGKPKVYS